MSDDGPRYPAPGHYVTIYCKAASHAGQPWIVGTWIRGVSREGVTYWRVSPDQYLAGVFVRSADERHDTARVAEVADGGVTQLLDMDSRSGRRRQVHAEREGRAIYSERLRCHLCGDAVKRTTANLHRDMDRLAEAGESDVTLAGYRDAMR